MSNRIPFGEYIRDLRANVERGDATEHTHRPALKALLESVDPDIVATNEPRRKVDEAPACRSLGAGRSRLVPA